MKQIKERDPKEQKALDKTYKGISFWTEKNRKQFLPQQETRLQRCLKFIQMLIQNSEKDGMRGCVPHNSLQPAQWLTITI